VTYALAESTGNLLMILAIVFLLFVLIFLAIAEMGLSRMTIHKAEALAEDHPRTGHALVKLVRSPELWVNPVLLTVNICQTVQATLTGIVAGRLFGVVGVIVGVVLNVVVFFVLAESLPKTWAVLSPERAALLAARPVAALVAFPPLRLVSRALIGLTNVLIPGRGLARGPFLSERELLGMVDAAVEGDVIEHEERELIESIIEFGDTVAREIMVPRPDMVTVPATATVSEALDTAIEAGFSRLPVIGESVDDIVGIAYTKDLMRAEREGHGAELVGPLARLGKFVPETKPVSRVMREMQADKFHLALVVDEYGGIAGLVTLEDCIEELVGEIVDEYDDEPEAVERLADGDLRVDGGLDIDELNDLLDIEVPNEDWDTVAGFVFGTLGHVPTEGETVEYEGHTFTAERVEGRRIATVRISPIPGWEPSAGNGNGAER
jgi:magnesium and cobalt exporter, CNNM family